MRVLYVKTNSEREKCYQLQTVIYEENGRKYVKKRAICQEAIPHLMSMQQKYEKLSASIINPNIRLAKIVKVEDDSLIFEFIEGVSLESKIVDALKSKREDLIKEVINSYLTILESGFSTRIGLTDTLNISEQNALFERFNFSHLKESKFFEEVSNVDLIFSNIIYADDRIYIIDYEWVFETPLPIKYALYRAFRSLYEFDELDRENYFSDDEYALFDKIERQFIFFEIMSPRSFYQFQERYAKTRKNLYSTKRELDEKVVNLTQEIDGLRSEIDLRNDEIEALNNEAIYYSLSRSWKITRPMRKFFTYIRGLR